MNFARHVKTVLSSLLIVALVACAPSRTREGTGEYVDDSIITGKVKAALVGDPELKAREINVETFKGTVQLSGFVSDPQEIEKAVKVAREVAGVKSVKNDMVVKK
jgi:osmotically-inducible protein OsmY